MWSNIGNVEEHKASMEFLPSPKNDTESGTGRFLFADCQAAIKGIFMGKKLHIGIFFKICRT